MVLSRVPEGTLCSYRMAVLLGNIPVQHEQLHSTPPVQTSDLMWW